MTEHATWHEVSEAKSSTIAGYGRDATGAFIVEYRKANKAGNRVYRYPDAPSGMMDRLMKAERPGSVAVELRKLACEPISERPAECVPRQPSLPLE